MKKFINILVAAAVTALAVVSCQKAEQVKPGTPDPEGCYGVYFPVQEATGSHTYDPEMDRSITFTVARTNTSGAITVPYTVKTDSEGVFEFEDIVFADGQAETEFEVTFDAIEEGKNSSFSIQLSDDNAYVSHYNTGAISIDFSVIVVKWEDFLDPKTGEPAVFTINSRWNGMFGPITATLKYYEVGGIRTGVFTSIDKNADSGELEGFWHSLPEVTLNIRWYTENQNSDGYDFVELPKQYFGYDYNGGDWLKVPLADAADPIFVYDYPWYWVERGYNWGSDGMGDNWLDEANKTGQMDGSYPVSYYDGNGGFFFNIYFYIPGLGGWSPDGYGTVAVASGFTRVDYSLEVETDYPSEGVTPSLFTVGADVAKVDYAIYEGSLNSVQIQARADAIAEGKEENVLTVSEFAFDEDDEIYYALVGLAPEKTGEYTLVAVAFNKTTEEITKSEAQSFTSLSFYHVSADDTEEYAVKVSVGTEKVPARYGEYDPVSSFAFYVTGTAITDARIAYFKTADYAKDPETNNLKVKASKSVDSSVVSEINAPGGYYAIIDKLNPLTSYTVVVWATNGDTEAYATAEYTTDGLPLELVATGDYKYEVAFSSWGTDKGMSLYYNPNYNNYVIQNIFYYVDFSFEMDDKGIIHFDPQDTGATYQGTPIYVLESHDYFTDEVIADPANEIGEEEAADIRKNSFYDSENKVYYFNMAFVVPGVGSFGHGWETFTVTAAAQVGSASPFNKQQLSLGGLSNTNAKWQAPASNIISVEREIKSISVEIKDVNYNREKKENKQISTIAGRALSTR